MVPPRSPIQNMVIHVAAVAKRQELIQHVLEQWFSNFLHQVPL